MNAIQRFLMKLAKPKGYVIAYIPEAEFHADEQYGRKYVRMDESLRLYFEDGEYVGFSTQEPYIG